MVARFLQAWALMTAATVVGLFVVCAILILIVLPVLIALGVDVNPYG